MPKPRGKIERSNKPEKARLSIIGEPTIKITAWCSDENAENPPEQVHIIFDIPGLEDMPIILRYKSPDTLGFILQELIAYRRFVWQDCEPIAGEIQASNIEQKEVKK